MRLATFERMKTLEEAGSEFTVADDGCSCSSVVDSAHSLVSLRPSRVLVEMYTDHSENQLEGTSAGRVQSSGRHR